MLMRTIVALAAIVALGLGNGLAEAHAPKHRRHDPNVQYVLPPVAPPALYGAGRLVLHPALNIACMTPYQATRALPCDQPVWVYGSPCEVDLGLGRYRSCE
ncbi:MAG: hypothetical protein WA303_16120 [Bradyrhizobium sp.]|jgi:hypothetical protein